MNELEIRQFQKREKKKGGGKGGKKVVVCDSVIFAIHIKITEDDGEF